jgi:hypothetical protein
MVNILTVFIGKRFRRCLQWLSFPENLMEISLSVSLKKTMSNYINHITENIKRGVTTLQLETK